MGWWLLKVYFLLNQRQLKNEKVGNYRSKRKTRNFTTHSLLRRAHNLAARYFIIFNSTQKSDPVERVAFNVPGTHFHRTADLSNVRADNCGTLSICQLPSFRDALSIIQFRFSRLLRSFAGAIATKCENICVDVGKWANMQL